MKQYKKYIKRKEKKLLFLTKVKKRLRNELGIYLELLTEAQGKNLHFPKVGFWAGIRLLMPVIEAVSDVLMRKSTKDPRPKHIRFLTKHLQIRYPSIVWEIYRHSLIHGDELRTLSYRDKKVNWGVSMNLTENIFSLGQSQIDVVKIYEDLINYLDKEISVAKGYVYVSFHVKLKNTAPGNLKKEVKELGAKN